MAASFDYTRKSWDKLRPVLLKSTGLGSALDAYEKTKVDLKSQGSDFDYVLRSRNLADRALDKVETCRAAAIKACGKMHKECANALSRADPKAEEKKLDSFCLTRFNAIIIYAVKDLKDFPLNLYTGRINAAEKFLSQLQGLNDEKIRILMKQDKLGTVIDKIDNNYQDEGQEKNNRALEKLAVGFGNMFARRGQLKGRYPTVASDLDKLALRIETLQKDERTYQALCYKIVQQRGRISEVYNRIKSEETTN